MMLVGLGGNNGTTITGGILANKQCVPATASTTIVVPSTVQCAVCSAPDAARLINFHSATSGVCMFAARRPRVQVQSGATRTHVAAEGWAASAVASRG